MEELRETELTASERYYQNHLNRMREYSKKNKELINERNRRHYAKITEDPEKHSKYLEKRREVYKQKKLKNKSAKLQSELDEKLNYQDEQEKTE